MQCEGYVQSDDFLKELNMKKVLIVEKIAGWVLGLCFIAALLFFNAVFQDPSPFQQKMLRIFLAVMAAGVGAIVAGFFNIEKLYGKILIRLFGASVLFVVIFFIAPGPEEVSVKTLKPEAPLQEGGFDSDRAMLQMGQDTTTIEKSVDLPIEGAVLHIGIKGGKVVISGDRINRDKIPNCDAKSTNLTSYIEVCLETIKQQEKRVLFSREKLLKAEEYGNAAVNQLKLLKERIDRLGRHEYTGVIKTALDEYDLVMIKRLLGEKLTIPKGANGETAFQLGCFQDIALENVEAYGSFKKAIELDPKNTQYLNAAGITSNTIGKYMEAVRYFGLALKLDSASKKQDESDLARDHFNLGLAFHAIGETEKAIGHYEAALAIDLKVNGEYHLSVERDRSSLGMAWQDLKDYNKAKEYYESAMATSLKVQGENHPGLAACRNNFGSALFNLGQFPKAIEYYEKALESDIKNYGEDHPNVARDRNNIGMAWVALGDNEKAIKCYTLAAEA
jgi:tetratricopeptide (TPR) repeat protein